MDGTKHLLSQALLLSVYQTRKSGLPYFLCCALCNASHVLTTDKTPILQGPAQVPTSTATLTANSLSKHLRNMIIPPSTTGWIYTLIILVRLLCHLEFRLRARL